MSSVAGLQCLRPYLFRDLPAARKLVYARFYNTTRCLAAQAAYNEQKRKATGDTSTGNPSSASPLGIQSLGHAAVGGKGRSPVEERIEKLKAANALVYPRIQRSSSAISFREYTKRYSKLKAGLKLDEIVTIRGIFETVFAPVRHTNSSTGRVLSVRTAGKKLVFLDLVQDGQVLQAICNLGNIESLSSETVPFRTFSHIVRRGDTVCMLRISALKFQY
jgi:lysyl-tRNA synthetase, class II